MSAFSLVSKNIHYSCVEAPMVLGTQTLALSVGPPPVAVATLTAPQVVNNVINCSAFVAATLTLPNASNILAYLSNDMDTSLLGYEFSFVINNVSAGAFALTLADSV